MSVHIDELYPRDEEHRYRLYVGEKVVAAAPRYALGTMILTLHEDARREGGKLYDDGRIGILDVMPDGQPSEKGEWVILPFARGGHV